MGHRIHAHKVRRRGSPSFVRPPVCPRRLSLGWSIRSTRFVSFSASSEYEPVRLRPQLGRRLRTPSTCRMPLNPARWVMGRSGCDRAHRRRRRRADRCRPRADHQRPFTSREFRDRVHFHYRERINGPPPQRNLPVPRRHRRANRAIAAATPALPKMDAREYAERITVKVTLVKLSISKPRTPESHVNSAINVCIALHSSYNIEAVKRNAEVGPGRGMIR